MEGERVSALGSFAVPRKCAWSVCGEVTARIVYRDRERPVCFIVACGEVCALGAAEEREREFEASREPQLQPSLFQV